MKRFRFQVKTMNPERLHHWMSKALDQAVNCVGDVPVGCVIIKDEQLIGQGGNQRERLNDPLGHAEIVAIRQAVESLGTWRLEGTTLYTTLEPCPMCAEAIIQCRVSTVVYGAADQVSGAAGSVFNLFVKGRPYPIPQLIAGIDEESCSALLQNFFRQRRASQEKLK